MVTQVVSCLGYPGLSKRDLHEWWWPSFYQVVLLVAVSYNWHYVCSFVF